MPAQRRKRTAGSERSANQTSVRSLASFGGVNTDEMKRAGAVLLEQRSITEVVVGETQAPPRALPFVSVLSVQSVVNSILAQVHGCFSSQTCSESGIWRAKGPRADRALRNAGVMAALARNWIPVSIERL